MSMPEKSKLQAEELLAKENFSEELLLQNAKDGNVDENEIRIARNIHSFLISSNESITHSDKEQIKNRIRSSVRKLYTKRQLMRWSVAATLLLAAVLTSVVYFRINSITEIVNFAQTLTNIKADNSTRIILQNGEEVRTDKKESQIKYNAKGEIFIDSEQKVVQKMNNSKVVFNTVIVPYGKRTQITLSEGTKVWLNSGSKLVYPAVFAADKREVYIDGEAVFDVTHRKDKPFVVSTKDFDIKVLGTIFNVSSYSDDEYSSTVLEQGKIELICRGVSVLSQEKLDISPGILAVFDRNQKTFEQQQVNPRKYLSWREGYLILNSEKLENIVKKLNRYYNIEMVIIDNDLKNATFSGYLDLKNSPEEVLNVINETTPLSYTRDQEKIFINLK
jgi:transmembrane sensor